MLLVQIPTETWVESFVYSGDDADPLLEFAPRAMLGGVDEVEVGADGGTRKADSSPSSTSVAEAQAKVKKTKFSIEGRFAYFPILDDPEPLDPDQPRGRQKYKGISVPIMVIDPAEGEEPTMPRKHEMSNRLPPIVSDHHHDFSGSHGSMVSHHHGGRAHRHANN